jgi:hypothetical protein
MSSNHSLASFFSSVQSSLGEEILQMEYAAILHEIMKELPPVQLVSLEARLENEDPQLDLNVCVWEFENEALKPFIKNRDGKMWDQVKKWSSVWSDVNKPYKALIPNIWLLYDVIPGSPGLLDPWIYIGFRNLKVGWEANLALTQRAIEEFPNNFSNAHWDNLQRIYTHLPPTSYMPAFGILEKRGFNAIRVGVRSFYDYDTMVTFLQEIGWGGDYDLIERSFREVIENAKYFDLSITVGESIFEDLGIECYLDLSDNAGHADKLLDIMERKGLCTAPKKRAIQRWIGNQAIEEPIWNHFHNKNDPNNPEAIIRRWILEFKMVYKPGHAPGAKAYIMFDYIQQAS